MQTRIFRVVSLIVMLTLLAVIGVQTPRAVEAQVAPQANFPVYLPLIQKACTAGQSYGQGLVYQYDNDNPVRPAYNHADKNFALRGYTTDNGQSRTLQAIVGATDTGAPQLNTLVSPQRKFVITSTRQSYNWNWGTPPNPGTRGSVIPSPAVTVVGLQVTLGETIRVPTSGYDLGQGVTAIVLYAAANSITLHYTRDDSGFPGYTIMIDNICVDPNLLALYTSLDGTARNTYGGGQGSGYSYNLPTLTSNQPIGTALTNELIVAIRDTGSFLDPRSCKDWWKAYWNGSTSAPVCN